MVVARWARTDATDVKIYRGYSAPLKGSSLEDVLRSGRPRVLNDLEQYLEEHPDSEATRLIVEEGVRSSLTCPLIALGVPVGFIFFSSQQKNTYQGAHVEIYLQIAGQLSAVLEKGRLYQQLLELNELKSKFLRFAAHDLKNLIAVITTYGELFEDGGFGELTPNSEEPYAR